MYINHDIKRSTDFYVIFDYPSYSDQKKGTIEASNAREYMQSAFRGLGLPVPNNSFSQVLDFPLGSWAKPEDYILTTKKALGDSNNTVFRREAGTFAVSKKVADSLAYIDQIIQNTKPKAIVCCSVLFLAYICGGKSLTAYRGSQLLYRGIPVQVTYSPMMLYKKPELSMAFNRDLARLRTPTVDAYSLPAYDLTIIPTFDEAKAWLSELLHDIYYQADTNHKLALDVETRGGAITFLGIATSPRTAIAISFIDYKDDNFFTEEEEFQLIKLYKAILSQPNVRTIYQNGQYDKQYECTLYGLPSRIDYDTMVDAHVVFQKGQRLSLDFLASLYCSYYRYWKEDGKDFHKSFQTVDDWHTYGRYNCYDTCYTFEVHEALQQVLKHADPFVVNFQRKMQNHVLLPILRGNRFDHALQEKWRREHVQLRNAYKAWFLKIVPQERVKPGAKTSWFDSPQQLGIFFYDLLQLTEVKDKKTGNRTTSLAALKTLGEMEPIVRILTDKLRDYSKLQQNLDLYLSAKPSRDGRVRSSYFVPGTDTYRLASKKDGFGEGMNLQNLSKG